MTTIVDIKHLSVNLDSNNRLLLNNIQLNKGQSLLICGDNSSGKNVLGTLIYEQPSIKLDNDDQVNIVRPKHIEWVSFTSEETILADDRYNDDSEFIEGGIDWGRNAGDIIGLTSHAKTIITLLGIGDLIDKPFKVLSTGQVRKVLLAKAIAAKPDLLILDEPYAGLDISSQQHLTSTLENLMERGYSVIIIDSFHQELPETIDKILLLNQGNVVIFNERTKVLSSEVWKKHNIVSVTLPHYLPDCHQYQHLVPTQAFAALNNVKVSYNNNTVFNNFSWQFLPKQHWRLSGPNGCGKSTLLSLINGDNPKAYGQDITLFGRKRGSGETVWDIKKHYGLVSAQLHRDYRASGNVLSVILSGFFDTIGLYDNPTETQLKIAYQWLELLGLTRLAKHPFSQLPYGEQRLILITRAVVKLPLILILDEPCLGLDNQHRMKILALIDYITRHSHTHILFVSHDSRDKLSCLTHQLTFISSDDGFTIEQSKLK